MTVTIAARQPFVRHPQDVLAGIAFGAAAAAWWPFLLAVRAPGPLLAVPLVAHVAGMLAGYGVLVLLALMSRAPWLEQTVGADRLARWHAIGGRTVLVLALVHAGAAVEGWAQARHELLPVALWHVLGLRWLLATTLGTALLVAAGVASARAARGRISHERWHLLHLLTYAGVALAFVHQLGGPDLAGHRVVQVLWSLLYVHTFALVLRHRVATPLRQAARHRLRVAEVRAEGPGVVTIALDGHHLTELGARPGQFFRWRFLTPDHWATAHPFSLSAPPRPDRLAITVKTLGDGTGRLQELPVGTWVVAEGPYGVMTAERRTRPHVVLVAGGVGITPMRALFDTIPIPAGGSLTLVYRARGPEHLLFRAQLDATATARGARIAYLLGADRECLSARQLAANLPHLGDSDVYLCGPPAMARAVRRSLRQCGVPAARLHEERFGG